MPEIAIAIDELSFIALLSSLEESYKGVKLKSFKKRLYKTKTETGNISETKYHIELEYEDPRALYWLGRKVLYEERRLYGCTC